MEAKAWQTESSSFEERHLYAYNNSLFCDVELSVMDANGDKVTIPAHKYVLAISSPVFEAMFYGKLAETGRTIDLPDCTKEGLQEMLRYVYSDEVNLTESNVLEVLYLAEKYMLPFLKEACEEYLEKELKPEDVFHVLPQIRSEKVEGTCWDMVNVFTKRALSSASFLKISKEMLCKVLTRDTLCIDEVDLFDAVEKWALNKLKQEGLEENRKNKKAVLGEEVIRLIRFPLMSQKEFAEMVLPSGILKMDEVTELIQYFNELSPLKCSFSNANRGKCKIIVPNTRFDSIVAPNELLPLHFSSIPDRHEIDFQVNKILSLVGIRMFGSKGSTYRVILTLYKNQIEIVWFISANFATEDEETDGYYGFTIHLEPIHLFPHDFYTIKAKISPEPPTYLGVRCKNTIAFEDIVITYWDSDDSGTGIVTDAEKAQFPTLIFKKY